MAWSAGPPTPPIQAPIQEQQIQLEIQPEPEALNQVLKFEYYKVMYNCVSIKILR